MSNTAIHEHVLPVGGSGKVSTAWWGMACLIATEGVLFVYLIFGYAYLGTQHQGPWPPDGPPSLKLALPNTVILIVSSIVLWWGLRSFRRSRDSKRLALVIAGTLLLGSVFAAVQGVEWAQKPFVFSTNSYSSIYFLLTGFHLAHVIAGLIMLLMLLVWTLAGHFETTHHEHLSLGAVYWHFVDLVWIAVLTTVYLVPQIR